MASKMDIDRSLDEIIASKPKPNRSKQGGARRGGAASGARARYTSTVPKGTSVIQTPLGAEVYKIIISNLPGDVTEPAVRDLMQSTVGPVKTVRMSFTSTGKSTGVATVVFKNRGDARKAHASYHLTLGMMECWLIGHVCGRRMALVFETSGSHQTDKIICNAIAINAIIPVQHYIWRQSLFTERPMKVELIVDPNQSLAGRVAPPPSQPQRRRAQQAAKPRNPRPVKKTAEQLDAEMAEYKQTSTA
nr:THO complex subunit 4 [Cryptococcus depauperatus CBS 7841]